MKTVGYLSIFLVLNPACFNPAAISPEDSEEVELAGGDVLDEWDEDYEDPWEGWSWFGEVAAGDESDMYARTVPEVAAVGDTITVEANVSSSYGRPTSPVWVRLSEPTDNPDGLVDPDSGPEWISMQITGGKITADSGNLVEVHGDEQGNGDFGESSYSAELTVPEGRTTLQFKVRAFEGQPELAFEGWDVTAPRDDSAD